MKDFLLLTNINAITYKEIFPLIKENRMWLGYTNPHNFEVPLNRVEDEKKQYEENGKIYQVFGNIGWFTNLPHNKRKEELYLGGTYYEGNPKYPKYDNYDAIEVSKVKDIPHNYDGVMGVPITFLGHYNPTQFEIVGFFNNYKPETADIEAGQIYGEAVKINSTKSLFRGPVVNGKATYFRILIRRKQL